MVHLPKEPQEYLHVHLKRALKICFLLYGMSLLSIFCVATYSFEKPKSRFCFKHRQVT